MIDFALYKVNSEFLDKAVALKKTTKKLRNYVSTANRENREFLRSIALYLKDRGESVSEIAEIMGKNESAIRLLLDEEVAKKMELPEIKMAVQSGE